MDTLIAGSLIRSRGVDVSGTPSAGDVEKLRTGADHALPHGADGRRLAQANRSIPFHSIRVCALGAACPPRPVDEAPIPNGSFPTKYELLLRRTVDRPRVTL